ncbi:hypothetical protein D3C81_1425080 [compost metagenome]
MLGQPFDRGLGADLGHAGDIVDRIADQRQVVDDALGRHAELGRHARGIEHFAAHGVDQRDLVVDQLRQVLVAGGYHRTHALLGGLARQRADHVVGLDAVDHHDRPAQRAHGLVDRLDLAGQVFRHGRAVFLVGRIHVVAEGLALCVEHAGAILCRVIVAQLAQHVDHAVDCPCGQTLSIPQVRQSVISAIQIARSVDEQECFWTIRHSHGLKIDWCRCGRCLDRPPC